MKYAILGVGAMGSLVGAFLAKAGQQVTLVDPYKEHMEQISNSGLKRNAVLLPGPGPDFLFSGALRPQIAGL